MRTSQTLTYSAAQRACQVSWSSCDRPSGLGLSRGSDVVDGRLRGIDPVLRVQSQLTDRDLVLLDWLAEQQPALTFDLPPEPRTRADRCGIDSSFAAMHPAHRIAGCSPVTGDKAAAGLEDCRHVRDHPVSTHLTRRIGPVRLDGRSDARRQLVPRKAGQSRGLLRFAAGESVRGTSPRMLNLQHSENVP
jgi:hypothetical protein